MEQKIMTYRELNRELMDAINDLGDEILDMEVCVFITGENELYPIAGLLTTIEQGEGNPPVGILDAVDPNNPDVKT